VNLHLRLRRYFSFAVANCSDFWELHKLGTECELIQPLVVGACAQSTVAGIPTFHPEHWEVIVLILQELRELGNFRAHSESERTTFSFGCRVRGISQQLACYLRSWFWQVEELGIAVEGDLVVVILQPLWTERFFGVVPVEVFDCPQVVG
jgi:hypothetical protein